MDFTLELDKKQLDKIEQILEEELIELGVQSVILIDLAGNVIVNLDNGKTNHDVYSLAALAAGNFGAVSAMANIIGEQEFSLLFHKGETDSIHFSKVTQDLLLITIFSKDVSLGFLRLKVNEANRKIQAMF
ncbi:roadblock/LC7 domain-containing protein [Desulforegula conservatrix]|uniref:roadblock/LC7 domain-containing protein n=1 Tax=Desulforegula conservatrix TaxID=153026 RepID=UPI00040AE64E|nr:roadblock/LC7 domain-containing protein [Desulforegula conservatrix]